MGNPTVTPLVENRREGGYVIWDPSDGMLTREAIVLLSGVGVCIAGIVLGAVLTNGAATTAPIGTNDGNGTFGAITVSGAARLGDFTVEFNSATQFVVNDPTGALVGHGKTGTAFTGSGLGFTITAGGTAFSPGDSFRITATGTLKYAPYDPTASDGRQNAAAILWSGYRDATAADRRAVANVRGPMRVNAGELLWGANVTTPQQQTSALAQLAKLGILNT
ncbi:MAG TPA: head decoration protein [Sphingobium sp.]|uniref:head decoration protein n=1 Tax=Sphingobium sp. TaxID=1912891 RepID=UPI002ED09BF0